MDRREVEEPPDALERVRRCPRDLRGVVGEGADGVDGPEDELDLDGEAVEEDMLDRVVARRVAPSVDGRTWAGKGSDMSQLLKSRSFSTRFGSFLDERSPLGANSKAWMLFSRESLRKLPR